MEETFLYKDLSYKIIGLCMAVHREYGNVHNERIYQKVLEEKLLSDKIDFKSKQKVSIYSRDSGKEIGFYVPDLVIDDKIIIELKATTMPLKRDEIQLSEYVKTSKFEVGYCVNFGLASLYCKRIIYTNNNKTFFTG